MKSYLCDTNFILRFLLKDVPKQAKTAKDIFVSAKRGEIQIYIPLLVCVEIEFALRKLYKFAKSEIISHLMMIAQASYLEVENKEILQHALQLYKLNNIDFVDSLFAIEAMIQHKKLLTFDRRLKRLKISA